MTCKMTVDQGIYVVALMCLNDLEKAIESATTEKEKRRVFLKYWHSIPPRAKPNFESPFEFGEVNIWCSSAIGIGMYMYDLLVDFAKKNGIKYEQATV